MMLSLLVAAAGLLGVVTTVPSPSKTASAPQETCSSIVVDSVTIEDAALVCCTNLALSVDNVATGVATGCEQANYSKYATKGNWAGLPAVASSCDIPVGESLAALGGLQLLCAHAEAA